jgi:hypothetical protein
VGLADPDLPGDLNLRVTFCVQLGHTLLGCLRQLGRSPVRYRPPIRHLTTSVDQLLPHALAANAMATSKLVNRLVGCAERFPLCDQMSTSLSGAPLKGCAPPVESFGMALALCGVGEAAGVEIIVDCYAPAPQHPLDPIAGDPRAARDVADEGSISEQLHDKIVPLRSLFKVLLPPGGVGRLIAASSRCGLVPAAADVLSVRTALQTVPVTAGCLWCADGRFGAHPGHPAELSTADPMGLVDMQG